MPKIRDSRPTKLQLFDLQADLGQQNDLADARPELLDRLRSELTRMHQDVVSEGHWWDIPEAYGANKARNIWNSE
jgi:hypothetical protein